MIKHTPLFYFLLLSIVASALNYLTYPILGRVLGADQFIHVSVALSLLTQIATVLLSVVALTIGLTKDKEDNQETIEHLQTVVIKLFVIIIILFSISSPTLFRGINLPPIYILPIALLLIFSVPSSVFSGYLNGKRKLVKVGIVAVITATFQFLPTIAVALISKSGALALIAMSVGHLLAIVLIVSLFREEQLPRIAINSRFLKSLSGRYKALLYYAVVASIGILLVNILQVIDLLAITAAKIDAKVYTDIYVISRAVFFGGLIFVWPFLSSIDVHDLRNNFKPTMQLLSFLFLVSATSVVLMYFFGNYILNAIMGTSYSLAEIRSLSTLSILYKFFWVGIMAYTLYFIVVRDYMAFIIPTIITIATTMYLILGGNQGSVARMYGLNTIALFGFIFCSISFWISLRSSTRNVYTK